MEPNTLVIKNDIKSEVQQEVLAEGTINPVLPGLHIPAIDVIEYFREAAGLALHSKIKFRQTPDINMPIKVKIFIPKPYHQHLYGLNPLLVHGELATIIFGKYMRKHFPQGSYAVIQTPIRTEWKMEKKSMKEYSKIIFNYIVYNDIGRQQWPWELPLICK